MPQKINQILDSDFDMSSENIQPTEEEQSLKIINGDEIDLIALAKTIWNGRKTIYYSVAISVVIGLIISFTAKPKYEASATLLPSAEKDMMGSMGGLGALAGMAGVDIGSMMGGPASGIPAEIYPSVVESYPFKKTMVHQKFHFEGYERPISLYQYTVEDSIESFGEMVMKYTLKLPWTIKNAFKEESIPDTTDYGVIALSEEEVFAMEAVQEVIVVEVDKKTGLINVSAEAREPILVAQFVQKAVDLLQEYVIKYKTKQSRENLEFIQARYEEKKVEYEKARLVFFQYQDQHRNMVSERINLEHARLKENFEMVAGVYSGLATQLEQAKITVKEQTPAFTILEPVKVPIGKSSPKKKILLVLSIILGGVLGISIILGRIVFCKVRNIWNR